MFEFRHTSNLTPTISERSGGGLATVAGSIATPHRRPWPTTEPIRATACRRSGRCSYRARVRRGQRTDQQHIRPQHTGQHQGLYGWDRLSVRRGPASVAETRLAASAVTSAGIRARTSSRPGP